MRKNLGRLALILFALAIASTNALSQSPVTATGTITTNTYSATADLFTAQYASTLISVQASTLSQLSGCTTSPQVAIIAGGEQVNLITLTNGASQWSSSANLPWAVSEGDDVSATLVTPGSNDCVNELPIQVQVSYQLAPTVPVPFNFTVQDVGGTPGTTVVARFTLVNCGGNVAATGAAILPQATKSFTANAQGVIGGVLYPTDGILCADQPTTYYQLTYIVGGVPSPIIGKYLIRSGPGTFNPAQAPVCISTQVASQQFCSLLGTPAGPIMIGPAGAIGPVGPAGPPGIQGNPGSDGEPGGEDFTIAIDQPATTDSGIIEHKIHHIAQFVRISCYAPSLSGTATVTVNFDIRAEASPGTPGGNVLTAPLVCGSATVVSTSFLNGTIAADAPLALDISAVSGTPQVLNIHVATCVPGSDNCN